jgi:hypothetical protein
MTSDIDIMSIEAKILHLLCMFPDHIEQWLEYVLNNMVSTAPECDVLRRMNL